MLTIILLPVYKYAAGQKKKIINWIFQLSDFMARIIYFNTTYLTYTLITDCPNNI